MTKARFSHLRGLFGIPWFIGAFKPVVVWLDLRRLYSDRPTLEVPGSALIEVFDEIRSRLHLATHYQF